MKVIHSLPVDIGIDEKQREEISQGLLKLLADTYTLYLKTHGFHWNVTGPMFQSLHTLFETQYNEMWMAVDEIAERVRTLDSWAPGSYAEISKLSTVKENKGRLEALQMVRSLVEGHETVIKTIRSIFPKAEKAGDQATVDLLTKRLEVHEKTCWMLRSQLA